MSMVFIASSGTLGSTTTNVQFSSVTQNFTHLQLRCFFKSAYAAGVPGLYITPWFNNTGGGSGYWHNTSGNGSTVSATYGSSLYYSGISGPQNSGTANIFGVAVVDILDYSSTVKNKTMRSIGGYDQNGAGIVSIGSTFRYDATTAINGFQIDDGGGGGWLAGSRFDLYGVTSNSVTGA